MSSATYSPAGFRLTIMGVFLLMRWKSSSVSATPASCAIASKCSTALVDPPVAATAAMAAMPGQEGDLNPNRAVYLLPAATQFETSGSVTASNRSLQWREKVIEPLWESRTDHMIMYQLAQKLGFGQELVKNYKMQKVKGMDEPVPEDILREVNKSNWTIGYTGQSPERLKAHMKLMAHFDVKTLKAKASVKEMQQRSSQMVEETSERVARTAEAAKQGAKDVAAAASTPATPGPTGTPSTPTTTNRPTGY